MAKKRGQKKGKRQRTWSADEDTFSREPVRGGAEREDGFHEREPEVGVTTEEANAVVIGPYGNFCYVQMEGEERLCRVGRGLGEGTSLAPGDRVLVEEEADGPVVQAMAPRQRKLSRLVTKHNTRTEQTIAVNVDQLVIVSAAAKPRFKRGMTDRYLISAQVGGVDPLLCVNKMDLVREEPPEVQPYRDLDVPVVLTSIVTGQGLDALRAALEDKVSVLAGASGVGKSTLINALNPDLDLATQEVSGFNEKGRHTTTSARMYSFGRVRIIDTPGVRKLGLWGVSLEELNYYFPELKSRALHCRFNDCTHTHEPGCAVTAAVEAGEISKSRYGSYLRIRESMEG